MFAHLKISHGNAVVSFLFLCKFVLYYLQVMKFSRVLRLSILLGGASAFDCSPAAFASILPANATVVSATSIPDNGTFNVPATDLGFPFSPTGLPALCAVEIRVQTPGNSSYGFGLFLPKKWNSRYL